VSRGAARATAGPAKSTAAEQWAPPRASKKHAFTFQVFPEGTSGANHAQLPPFSSASRWKGTPSARWATVTALAAA
jgi:hypothetical protein